MVENLKDLTKLIALLRKSGVSSFKYEGMELILGPEPRKAAKAPSVTLDPGKVPKPMIYEDKIGQIGTDPMSPATLEGDALLFYSAGGSQ